MQPTHREYLPTNLGIRHLTDEELWLLTCGLEMLHDSMRDSREEYIGDIVERAGNLRADLEVECGNRNIDHKRWCK